MEKGQCRDRSAGGRLAHAVLQLDFIILLLGVLALTQTATAQATRATGPTCMDDAIALLTEARVQFQLVRDYECRLVKRERVHGALLPETTMSMKVRNNPLSIYLHREGPDAVRAPPGEEGGNTNHIVRPEIHP